MSRLQSIVAVLIAAVVGLAGCADSPSVDGDQISESDDEVPVSNQTIKQNLPGISFGKTDAISILIEPNMDGFIMVHFDMEVRDIIEGWSGGSRTSLDMLGWLIIPEGEAAPDPAGDCTQNLPRGLNLISNPESFAIADVFTQTSPGRYEVWLMALGGDIDVDFRFGDYDDENGTPIEVDAEPLIGWEVGYVEAEMVVTNGQPDYKREFSEALAFDGPGWVKSSLQWSGTDQSWSADMELQVDQASCLKDGAGGSPNLLDARTLQFSGTMPAGNGTWSGALDGDAGLGDTVQAETVWFAQAPFMTANPIEPAA